jgi:hypothetical protein
MRLLARKQLLSDFLSVRERFVRNVKPSLALIPYLSGLNICHFHNLDVTTPAKQIEKNRTLSGIHANNCNLYAAFDTVLLACLYSSTTKASQGGPFRAIARFAEQLDISRSTAAALR